MKVHKNARLTPRGRERIVRQVASGQTPEAVAEAVGVCPRTVRRTARMGLRARLPQLGISDRPNCRTGSIAIIGIGHMVA
jgi:hypothetical protein